MHEKSFQILQNLDLASLSDQPSPVADLEHPFALSLTIVPATNVIDKTDCKRMLEIGDRRWLIADPETRTLPNYLLTACTAGSAH